MFENLGFFKEYYIQDKFIGSIKCDKDRDIIGYLGRKKETLSDKIVLDNKKVIKAGIEVITILFPLNGKLINK